MTEDPTSAARRMVIVEADPSTPPALPLPLVVLVPLGVLVAMVKISASA